MALETSARSLKLRTGTVAVAASADGAVLSTPAGRIRVLSDGVRCIIQVEPADGLGLVTLGERDAHLGLGVAADLASVADAGALRVRCAALGASAAAAPVAPTTHAPVSGTPAPVSGTPAPLPAVDRNWLEQRIKHYCDKTDSLSPALFSDELRPYVAQVMGALTDEDRDLLYRLGRKADSPVQVEQEILHRVYGLLPDAARGQIDVRRAERSRTDLRRAGTTIYNGERIPTGWLPDGADGLIQYALRPGAAPEATLAAPAAPSVPVTAPVSADGTVDAAEIPDEGADTSTPATSKVPQVQWRNTATVLAGRGLKARPLRASMRLESRGGVAASLQRAPILSPYRFSGDEPNSVMRIGNFVCTRSGWATDVVTVTDRRDGTRVTVGPSGCSECGATCAHVTAARAAVRAEVRFLASAAEHDAAMLGLRDALASRWAVGRQTKLERALGIGHHRASSEGVSQYRFSYRIEDAATGTFGIRDEMLGRTYRVRPDACSCGADACAHRDMIRQRVRPSDLARRGGSEDASATAPSTIYEALAHWHEPDLDLRIKKNDRQEMAKHVRRALIDENTGGFRGHLPGALRVKYDPLTSDRIEVSGGGNTYAIDTDFRCSCGQDGCRHARAAEQAIDGTLARLCEASRYDEDYRRMYDHVRSSFRMPQHRELPTGEALRVMRTRAGMARILPWLRGRDQLRVTVTGAREYVVEDTSLGIRYPLTGPQCSCGTYRAYQACAHVHLLRRHIDEQIEKSYRLFWRARKANERGQSTGRTGGAGKAGGGRSMLDYYGVGFITPLLGAIGGGLAALLALGRGGGRGGALATERAEEQARARIEYWKAERSRFGHFEPASRRGA